ncbi:F0F1 ATP synthase subunit B [Gaoshiqia sediminis]|uniref:ATP synthase subunit b n=1 Tax=Gaoshiqia sediminis TaxID=2986998 RepID=A0AA42C941_9BACT|nr:F0F1 ATP synthase subunit B [Gaoshiqia sediminis]MCW0481640.1 F0F1 ATP synthase subunit B [Gaoshiqia sediminis]
MGFVTPDYGTIFWMVIVFGITLYILKRFAWKPILNALKNREASIYEALTAADQARKEVAGLKADHDKIIAEARREKEIILREATNIKDKIVAEAKAQANAEGLKVIQSAREQIEAEKQEAIKDMKKQVVELSVMVAEKIIRKEMKEHKDQEALVNELLKDLKLK